MSVYVDELNTYPVTTRWRFKQACHLIADDVEELKEFAVTQLGLKVEWFQPLSSPHFDLTKTKRELAVRKGAIELTQRQFVAKIRKLRDGKNRNNNSFSKRRGQESI